MADELPAEHLDGVTACVADLDVPMVSDQALRPDLRIAAEVTPEDEQTARNAIEFAIAAVEACAGFATRGFTAFVFADADPLGEAICAFLSEPPGSPTCQHFRQAARDQIGGGDVGFIFTRTDGWPEIFGGGTAVMIHEYIQALIDDLIGDVPRDPPRGDEIPLVGPRWLLEGFPTFMRFLVQFPKEFDELRQGAWQSASRTHPVWPALPVTPRDLDDAEDAELDMMLVAVDVLVTDFDAQPHDFLTYYERIGQGMPWQQSFEQSFGRTIDDFYEHLTGLEVRSPDADHESAMGEGDPCPSPACIELHKIVTGDGQHPPAGHAGEGFSFIISCEPHDHIEYTLDDVFDRGGHLLGFAAHSTGCVVEETNTQGANATTWSIEGGARGEGTITEPFDLGPGGTIVVRFTNRFDPG